MNWKEAIVNGYVLPVAVLATGLLLAWLFRPKKKRPTLKPPETRAMLVRMKPPWHDDYFPPAPPLD